MTATLGADPEFFLFDDNYGAYGGIRPCVGLIPGTKDNPTPLGVEGFAVHEDNVVVELMIPPTSRISTFANHIVTGKQLIVDEYLSENKQWLSSDGAHCFEANELSSTQAKTFGCEPDYDAYTGGKVRTVGKEIKDGRWRYAGGHVHLGGFFNCPPFVAALFADIFITLPSYLGGGHSGTYALQGGHARQRLEWYGQPGIFRAKPYGIEYRTPSSYWTIDGDSAHYMGDKAMRLIHYLENTSALKIREALNNINWLGLQKLLTNPPKEKLTRENEVYELLDKIGKVVPT